MAEQRDAVVQELAEQLRRLIARALVFNHQVADALGLNATDHQCLSLLELYGEMQAHRLATLVGLSPSAMTAAIDRLERAGFVRRKPDTRDRRAILIEPNAARLAREARRFYGGRSAAMGRVYARFSEEQLTTVLAFLQAMAEERPAIAAKN